MIETRKAVEKERILDIGGGGEGIISKIYKEKVVAIDIRPEELEEIDEKDSLKVVMDASKLLFLYSQFDKVTAFFSLMYVRDEILNQVIQEAYRVLKIEGCFEVWDVEMPAVFDTVEELFVVHLEVKMGEESVRTGYGVKSKQSGRSMTDYCRRFEGCGFRAEEKELFENGTFYIKVKKI